MADGLNRVMLIGNLGAEPELKLTAGNQAVLRLRLATTESYLDKSNQRQSRTEWHSVTVWGRRGEALHKILDKGKKIFVEGGLRTTTYDKDGQKHYRTEIVASNILLLDSRGREGADDDMPRSGASGSGYRSTPPKAPPANDPGDDFPADDIPF